MTSTTPPAPPFDPELKTVLDIVSQSIPSTLSIEDLPGLRGPGFTPLLSDLLTGRAITHEEIRIPRPAGGPDLVVSVFREKDTTAPGRATSARSKFYRAIAALDSYSSRCSLGPRCLQIHVPG